MTRWIRRAAILLLLVAVIVALRLTVFRPEPVPVTVFRVDRGTVESTVTNSKAGTIKSRLRAALSPEIGGRVAALPVRKGARVETGDLLLRLSDEDRIAEVRLQERSVEAAEASERAACLRAEQAQRELDRNLRLAQDRIVSQDLLDRLQNERDVSAATCQEARARVLQARNALDAARVALSKTRIRAPFDGVIAELDTELGEWITPSPPGVPLPPVIDLLDTNSMYVSAPLDEVDVGKVREGQPVRITMDAYPDRSFPGKVVRVAPYVQDFEEQNRTFEIEVEFDDSTFAAGLLSGTSADVEVILESKPDVLRIPTYALMEGGTVLVLHDDVLESVAIESGLRNWEFTEVTAGLSEEEPVVVSLDRPEVKEGARATVEAETLR
jgi:HlyD family secretion protein